MSRCKNKVQNTESFSRTSQNIWSRSSNSDASILSWSADYSSSSSVQFTRMIKTCFSLLWFHVFRLSDLLRFLTLGLKFSLKQFKHLTDTFHCSFVSLRQVCHTCGETERRLPWPWCTELQDQRSETKGQEDDWWTSCRLTDRQTDRHVIRCQEKKKL